MQENFRQFLDRLRQTRRARRSAPARRHPPHRDAGRSVQDGALFSQGDRLRHAGRLRHHPHAASAPRWRSAARPFGEIEDKLRQAIDQPIAPKLRQDLADARGGAHRRRRRSLQFADPDVLDLRRRPDDHRRRRDRARSRARLQQRHLPLHREGKESHRHRHRHAQQYAAVRPARLRAGPAAADLDQHRHPSDRDHGLRAIARRSASTRWPSPAACAARRSSSRPARPSTCPTSPTPRSCSRRRFCRPAGPGRKGASASSRG